MESIPEAPFHSLNNTLTCRRLPLRAIFFLKIAFVQSKWSEKHLLLVFTKFSSRLKHDVRMMMMTMMTWMGYTIHTYRYGIYWNSRNGCRLLPSTTVIQIIVQSQGITCRSGELRTHHIFSFPLNPNKDKARQRNARDVARVTWAFTFSDVWIRVTWEKECGIEPRYYIDSIRIPSVTVIGPVCNYSISWTD